VLSTIITTTTAATVNVRSGLYLGHLVTVYLEAAIAEAIAAMTAIIDD
jgi:hypothetical protein